MKAMEERNYSATPVHSKKAMIAVKTGKIKASRTPRVAAKPDGRIDALTEQISMLAKSVTTLVEENDEFKNNFFTDHKVSDEDVVNGSDSSDE